MPDTKGISAETLQEILSTALQTAGTKFSQAKTAVNRDAGTLQPAYMARFGAAKTVPYNQKNHIREVNLYIYTLGSIASET